MVNQHKDKQTDRRIILVVQNSRVANWAMVLASSSKSSVGGLLPCSDKNDRSRLKKLIQCQRWNPSTPIHGKQTRKTDGIRTAGRLAGKLENLGWRDRRTKERSELINYQRPELNSNTNVNLTFVCVALLYDGDDELVNLYTGSS